MIEDNGYLVDPKTGIVIGIVFVDQRKTNKRALIESVINEWREIKYHNRSEYRNIVRAKIVSLMIAYKFYPKRLDHVLICFDLLRKTIDFTHDHVKFSNRTVEWMSSDFMQFLLDVYKCSNFPPRVLNEVIEYLSTF